MDKLYERADIYDLLENEQRWQSVLRHWQTLLDGKNITTLLDVSIGTGNLTLPLCELGVRLTGSDLNPAMLTRCREKAAARGFSPDLAVCDFRSLDAVFEGRQFDWQFPCICGKCGDSGRPASDGRAAPSRRLALHRSSELG